MEEEDVINLIKEDQWMMQILRAASSLNLPDWWICAGFVRSKVWDTLHDFAERTDLPDIDVIYFDSLNLSDSKEKMHEEQLTRLIPNAPWSVKNEARMHIKSNMTPYTSSVDAISKFPETATAIAVKLDKSDQVVLAAPYGLDDLIQLKVKPTSYFRGNKDMMNIYESRIIQKNWKSTWPKLDVIHTNKYT